MLNTRYIILDTETTGLRYDDKVVSAAFIKVEDGVKGEELYHLIHPNIPIPAASTAIHGITDKDVEDCEDLPTLLPSINAFCSGSGPTIYVAHNASFDRRMLPGLATGKWLDTLALARLLCPGLPSYKNEDLYKSLELEGKEEGTAHNALYDAKVTTAIFLRLLQLAHDQGITSVEELLEKGGLPAPKPLTLLTTCTLPKFKGKDWKDIPSWYLLWIVGNYRGDPSVVYTAKHYLST